FEPPRSGEDEHGFWRRVYAADIREGYESYLPTFPKGQYADIARQALATSGSAAEASVAPPPTSGPVRPPEAPSGQRTKPTAHVSGDARASCHCRPGARRRAGEARRAPAANRERAAAPPDLSGLLRPDQPHQRRPREDDRPRGRRAAPPEGLGALPPELHGR